MRHDAALHFEPAAQRQDDAARRLSAPDSQRIPSGGGEAFAARLERLVAGRKTREQEQSVRPGACTRPDSSRATFVCPTPLGGNPLHPRTGDRQSCFVHDPTRD